MLGCPPGRETPRALRAVPKVCVCIELYIGPKSSGDGASSIKFDVNAISTRTVGKQGGVS